MKLLITGEHPGLPAHAGGRTLHWTSLAVLDFEPLNPQIPPGPWDWVLFSSRRGVEFWKGPLEGARVACVGMGTAKAAEEKGMTVAFYPQDSGSEGFVRAFLTGRKVQGERWLLPSAEGGRTLAAEELRRAGAEVCVVALYRSVPRADILVPQDVDGVVVTSPSSWEAIVKAGGLTPGKRIFCLGGFTAETLRRHQVSDFREIPAGDLARIGEVL